MILLEFRNGLLLHISDLYAWPLSFPGPVHMHSLRKNSSAILPEHSKATWLDHRLLASDEEYEKYKVQTLKLSSCRYYSATHLVHEYQVSGNQNSYSSETQPNGTCLLLADRKNHVALFSTRCADPHHCKRQGSRYCSPPAYLPRILTERLGLKCTGSNIFRIS